MCFFEGLLKSFSNKKEPKRISVYKNIYMENGILKVRDMKKVSNEDLIELVGIQIIKNYLLLLKMHESNKKITWDYITYMNLYTHANVEFIKRFFSVDYLNLDTTSLRPYINKLERPYTISYQFPRELYPASITITFINTPTSETKSEEYEKEYLETMTTKMENFLDESYLIKSINDAIKMENLLNERLNAPNKNATENTEVDEGVCDEKDVLLESSLRQRKV